MPNLSASEAAAKEQIVKTECGEVGKLIVTHFHDSDFEKVSAKELAACANKHAYELSTMMPNKNTMFRYLESQNEFAGCSNDESSWFTRS